MKERGLSLRALEYKTDLDHTTILRVLNGRDPTESTVIKLAVGLGEPLNNFMTAAGFQEIPEELVCPDTKGHVMVWLEDNKKHLTEEDREEIIRIVEDDQTAAGL